VPPYAGFCGPSNPSQSVQADCEKLVNWYVERVESAAAPTGAALYPTPGQRNFLTTVDVEPRAIYGVGGRCFGVVGTGFYEFFADGTDAKRGIVASDLFPATISYNGISGGHLFITSGGNGYCFVLATNALTTVLTGEATMGGMINSRFLAFNISNGKVRMSALNDGTTWDPTLFFQRSQAADPWQTMIVNPPEIWLIGEQTGEVWYDAGLFPQPFTPIPGAFFKYGTAAPFSGGVAGEYVTWLARTKDGQGTIVAAKGYVPQAISNFAVETALSGFARTATLADAELLVQESEGHLFANFSFPTARRTWTCDLSMGMLWHERGRWDRANNSFDVWSPRVHTYAFNKHLVGNRGTGSIAVLDVTYGSEADGAPIRRVRIPPPLWASSRERLVVSRLELKAETGLGLASGQGADPQVMLRTSMNAKTWSSERLASAGKQGDYDRQIAWTQCGSAEKLWVPEISVSDPIPWRLSGAEIDGTGFVQAGA
jgi:hypothetical protein